MTAAKKDVLDQLVAGRDPRDNFSKSGLVNELKMAISYRLLDPELHEHLAAKNAGG